MINTTLVYIRQGDSCLMLLRNKKKNDLNEGKWVGLGGKFEPGETAEECMLREVREESGLELTSYTFHGIVYFISDKWEDEAMYLYSGEAASRELHPRDDEGELHWIPADQVMDLPMWEGDRVFLPMMADGVTGIDLTLRYEGDDLVEVTDRTERRN